MGNNNSTNVLGIGTCKLVMQKTCILYRLDENQDEILYINQYECLPHHSCVFLEEVE